jgi:hypothetical protein
MPALVLQFWEFAMNTLLDGALMKVPTSGSRLRQRPCQAQARPLTIMMPPFPLPLPNKPPDTYAYRLEASDDLEDGDDYDSVSALATAFNTGIDQRDSFLGRKRCVICGMGDAMVLRRCHIVGQAELRTVESKMHLDPPEANACETLVVRSQKTWLGSFTSYSGTPT